MSKFPSCAPNFIKIGQTAQELSWDKQTDGQTKSKIAELKLGSAMPNPNSLNQYTYTIRTYLAAAYTKSPF
jgi:hypothetical protein